MNTTYLKEKFSEWCKLTGRASTTITKDALNQFWNWIEEIPLPEYKEAKEIFENNSDCYADMEDDSVVMAMTKERFIEILPLLVANQKNTQQISDAWVSVHKPPTEMNLYNIYFSNTAGSHVDSGYWNGAYFQDQNEEMYPNVTHWMPLPKKPLTPQ